MRNWLNGGGKWTSQLCENLTKTGRPELIKFAYEHGCRCAYVNALRAVRLGNIRLFQLILQHEPKLTKMTLETILARDAAEMLAIAIKRGCLIPKRLTGKIRGTSPRCAAFLDRLETEKHQPK